MKAAPEFWVVDAGGIPMVLTQHRTLRAAERAARRIDRDSRANFSGAVPPVEIIRVARVPRQPRRGRP